MEKELESEKIIKEIEKYLETIPKDHEICIGIYAM